MVAVRPTPLEEVLARSRSREPYTCGWSGWSRGEHGAARHGAARRGAMRAVRWRARGAHEERDCVGLVDGLRREMPRHRVRQLALRHIRPHLQPVVALVPLERRHVELAKVDGEPERNSRAAAAASAAANADAAALARRARPVVVARVSPPLFALTRLHVAQVGPRLVGPHLRCADGAVVGAVRWVGGGWADDGGVGAKRACRLPDARLAP